MTTKKATPKKAESAKVVKYEEPMDFLPADYKIPKKSDQFLKFEPGSHKIRIMTPPIKGFVFFAEKEGNLKPIRRTEEFGNFSAAELVEHGAKVTNGKIDGAKYFWLMLVYDYKTKLFKALEVTQVTLLEPIVNLFKHEEYGDPRGYDITITRKGTSINDTEYTVIASPPKQLDKAIHEEFKALTYNMNAVLEGEYPLQ